MGTVAAGWAVSVTTSAAIVGRIATGAFVDRIDRRAAACANFSVQVIATARSVPMLYLGCALFRLGVGNMISLPGLIVQQEFARQDFARVVSLVVAINQFTFAFGPARRAAAIRRQLHDAPGGLPCDAGAGGNHHHGAAAGRSPLAIVNSSHRSQRHPRSCSLSACHLRTSRGISEDIVVDAAELKQMQAPHKERYRNEPQAAVITLKAEGALGEGVTCSVQTARALVDAGLHPATGGSGLHACSGDMLLEALVACAGVTLNAVATALEIPVRAGRVRAEGDLDFRGTLGVVKDAPVGFKAIRLRFDLDSDASEEQLATLMKLTERYCVVYQTLRQPPAIEVGCEARP
jgi:uncharacterized OsmC-like protein